MRIYLRKLVASNSKAKVNSKQKEGLIDRALHWIEYGHKVEIRREGRRIFGHAHRPKKQFVIK